MWGMAVKGESKRQRGAISGGERGRRELEGEGWTVLDIEWRTGTRIRGEEAKQEPGTERASSFRNRKDDVRGKSVRSDSAVGWKDERSWSDGSGADAAESINRRPTDGRWGRM